MEKGHEFIDHPADIQIHSWGKTLGLALESLGRGMFEVMFELKGFNSLKEKHISVKGHDIHSMVYKFLDEWLFLFDTEDFVAPTIVVKNVNLEDFSIEAVGYGEDFLMEKHHEYRRTEVKAITYASMKVDITSELTDIFVILDL